MARLFILAKERLSPIAARIQGFSGSGREALGMVLKFNAQNSSRQACPAGHHSGLTK